MYKKIFLCILFLASLFRTTANSQEYFRHPGLLHSEADFEAVKQRLADGDSLTQAALAALKVSPPVLGDHGYNWAVNEYISRGISGSENYMNAYRNAARAYQFALLWKITGESGYGDAAIDILNAYPIYNTGLSGNTNISLITGFIGYQFLNAAEIMRQYDGWDPTDIQTFKQYMIDVWFTVAQDFLERRHDTVTNYQIWYHYHSNWGLGNALFCISLGIFCDLPDIYNYGMYWLKEGPGNESLCVTAVHPDAFGEGLCGYGWGLIPWFHSDERGTLGYLNQMQESGRDQGHSLAALGLLSYALESAYNQGDNAFCNLNNSLINGKAGSAMVAGAAEYVAAYNTGVDDLPFKTNWWMTALSSTSRGQWRPIWQLYINHYQNKMGIDMPYCTTMHQTMGMELGGGSYGTDSGGYDQTGFGDLMYNDQPATQEQIPTILFPKIITPTETRKYAEIKDVQPGTQLTLTAELPTGETNTGNWTWEDGTTGQQRTITADSSAVFRLNYTNTYGTTSTQMFCIAVRGYGIRATLTATATYNGQTLETDTFLIGQGRQLSITTAYTNWNYIETEYWYDENGNKLASEGSYTYTLADNNTHKLIFQLTNQSGVVIEKTFVIIPNENELTQYLDDPDCENPDLWQTTIDGFEKTYTTVSGFTQPYIQRLCSEEQNGLHCWGQEPFDINSTISGLTPGKYRLGACIIATQQSKTDQAQKNYVDDIYLHAGGAVTPVATLDETSEYFTVDFYVGTDSTATYGLTNVTNQNYAYSENGANRVAMDNYSLFRLTDTNLAADIDSMRAKALEIQQGTVTDSLYNQLTNLLTQTTNTTDYAVQLQTTLAQATIMQVHYQDYLTQYNTINNYLATQSITDDSLNQALTQFAQAQTTQQLFRAYETLTTAWLNYLPDATQTVDLTTMLPQHGKLIQTDGYYDYNTHWMTDATGGNFRIFPIDGSDTDRGEATDENMIERWCTAAFDPNQNLIYTTISRLPQGQYTFAAAAQKGTDTGVIKLFAGNQTTPVSSAATLRQYQVTAQTTTDTLSFGIKSGTSNASQWTSMADLTLQYTSPILLLQEAIAAADTLNYGTDNNDALQTAVNQAVTALQSQQTDTRMQAYTTLVQAMKQYRIDNATQQHPVDFTDYIDNAGFENGSNDWTVTTSSTAYPAFYEGTAEFWHCTFDISQTLTTLPVGNYRISLQARSDTGKSNKSFRMYVKTTAASQVNVYATATTVADGTDTSLHLSQNALELSNNPSDSRIQTDVFVGDGKLQVGALCELNTMWCVMRDFRLDYIGVSDDDLIQMWATQTAIANALDREEMPQAQAQLLDTAVDLDPTTVTTDSLAAALSNLMATIENAQQVMEVYAEYLQLRAIVVRIAENSEPKLTSSLTLLNTNIEQADQTAQQAVTTTELQTAITTLETARQAYVVNAEPLNGINFDMTFKITNPQCNTDEGWLNDGTTNARTLTNTAQNGQYTQGVFFENWITPGYELTDGQRYLYQEISSLPNGNYTLTAAAFRAVELSSADEDRMNVSLYLNNRQTEITSTVLDYFTVDGSVTSRTAEIGITTGAGNTANWVGLADVSLLYYGSADSQLSQYDTVFELYDGLYGDVTMQQTLLPDVWNLVCLPFDLSYSQVRKIFDDVKQLTAVETTDDRCNLLFEDVREITGGLPLLVMPSESMTSFTYESVAIVGQPQTTTVTDGNVTASLVGTYHVTTPSSTYFAYAPNAFTAAASGTSVNAFTAYLELTGAETEQIDLYIDGVLTAVRGIETKSDSTSADSVDVYTLDGRRIRSGVAPSQATAGLNRGLYIVGGRKVVVK